MNAPAVASPRVCTEPSKEGWHAKDPQLIAVNEVIPLMPSMKLVAFTIAGVTIAPTKESGTPPETAIPVAAPMPTCVTRRVAGDKSIWSSTNPTAASARGPAMVFHATACPRACATPAAAMSAAAHATPPPRGVADTCIERAFASSSTPRRVSIDLTMGVSVAEVAAAMPACQRLTAVRLRHARGDSCANAFRGVVRL